MRWNKLLCPNYCVQFLNAPDITPDKLLRVSNIASKNTNMEHMEHCVLIYHIFIYLFLLFKI